MTTVAAILKHKGYQVSTVDPTAPVSEIAQMLSDRRIGAALVMDAPPTDARMIAWQAFKAGTPVYFYWHAVHWERPKRFAADVAAFSRYSATLQLSR